MSTNSYSDSDINILAKLQGKSLAKKLNEGVSYVDFLETKLEICDDRDYYDNLIGSNPKFKSKYPMAVKIAPDIKTMCKIYYDNFDDIFESIKDIEDELTRNKIRCEMFKKLLKPQYEFTIMEPPVNGMWFGNTTNGINIRPGLEDGDTKKIRPFMLADDAVHALMVGITGSGKSVAMNAISMNWLYEYPPWELNIYMGDFKKVELSRYGNVFKTPHVKVIAATDSPSYVVSMFQFLENEMNAAKQLFSEFGIQNIKGFRDQFGLVVPRSVVIVDEFTQAFEKASTSEIVLLERSIQAVAKLGRSMGYHLMFGSQTMSGTVSSSVLNQFRLGLALNSDDTTSNLGIGNSGAVGLSSMGKGWVVVNPSRIDGEVKNNVKLRVPYINAEEEVEGGISVFYSLLRDISNEAAKVGYKSDLQFYNESSLRAYRALLKDLEDTKQTFSEHSERRRESNVKVLTKLILGDTTRYLGSDAEIMETMEIVCNRSRNIFVHSKSEEEIRYIMLLLTANFRAKNYTHKIFVGDIELYNNFKVGSYLDKCELDISEEFDMSDLQATLEGRKNVKRYSNYSMMKNDHSFKLYTKWASTRLVDLKGNPVLGKLALELAEKFKYDFNALEIAFNSDTELGDAEYNAFSPLYWNYKTYEDFRGKKKYASVFDFEPIIVWMFDPYNLYNCFRRGALSGDCATLFEECPAHNIYFVFITKKYNPVSEIAKLSNYFLVSSPEEKIYSIEDFNEINPVDGVNIRVFDKSATDKTNFNFKKFQVTDKVFASPFS